MMREAVTKRDAGGRRPGSWIAPDDDRDRGDIAEQGNQSRYYCCKEHRPDRLFDKAGIDHQDDRRRDQNAQRSADSQGAGGRANRHSCSASSRAARRPPMVAPVATDEPDMELKAPQPSSAAIARPPGQ